MNGLQLYWRLGRHRPVVFIGHALLLTMLSVLDLTPALVVRQLFDSLSGRASIAAPTWALIALLAVPNLAIVATLVATLVAESTLMLETAALLRTNVLAEIFDMPGAAALREPPGETVSRLGEDALQLGRVLFILNRAFATGVFSLVALTIMLHIDAFMTLVVFLPLVIVGVLVNRAGGRLESLRMASRKVSGEVSGALGDVFNSVQAIKLAGAEEHVAAHFQRLGGTRRALVLRDRLFSLCLDSANGLVVNLGTGTILLLAGQAIHSGTFGVGDFALFMFFLNYTTVFTGAFGQFLAAHKQSQVALERLASVVASGQTNVVLPAHRRLDAGKGLPLEPRVAEDKIEKLEVRGLTYRYPQTGHGVEAFDLYLRRGSFIVITGAVGSGKTTALRAMLGLLPGQEGVILWNGTEVRRPADWFVPPRVAYTPQVPRLVSGSLLDNILLGRDRKTSDIQGSLRTAVLDVDVASLVDGLDTSLGPRGIRLSGGQVQRVAAARMFIRQPELLVFDDLSSALDIRTEQELWHRLFDAGRGQVTCLAVSHRLVALERADSIILLRNGRVAGRGSLHELIATNDEMAEFYESIRRDPASGSPD